jgi:hypothetical protein
MNENSSSTPPQLPGDWKAVARWFAIVAGGFYALIMTVGAAIAEKHELAGVAVGGLFFSLILTTLGFCAVLFFRWIRQPKSFRSLVFAIACLTTLTALFYAVENWRGKRAWDKYRQAAEAKGAKFDRQDLIPASVPDDQNFAMTPYFALLFDFLPGTQQHRETNWTQPFENLKQKVGTLDLKAPEKARTTSWSKPPSDLPIWYIAFLRDVGSKTNNLSLTNLTTQELAAQVLAGLTAADPVLDEIRLASQRPQARFNISYDHPDPAAVLLPHLSILKHLTQLLQLRASAALVLGQAEGAAQDMHLMFYLIEVIHREPILISHLVRIAQLQIILQPLTQGLETHQWSDAQLQSFLRQVESFNFCADAQTAMHAERVIFGGGIFDYFRRLGSRERFGIFKNYSEWPDSNSSSLAAFYAGAIPSGWYYLEQRNYDQAYQAFLLPTIDITNQRINPNLTEQAHVQLECSESPTRAFLSHRALSHLLLPALPGVAKKTARGQAAVDLAIIACGLERFHLANGKYPPELKALAPHFISKLPHDVITGQPYQYRRTADEKYSLYAVGWNEKDDGGTLAWEKERTIDWDNGDWVWRYAQP